MDVVKFLKERKRMCDSFGIFACDGCQIYESKGEMMCSEFQGKHLEQAVAIVEKWSKEHPQETRLSRFLKYYPNAPLEMYGIPHTCVKNFGIVEYEYLCSDDCHNCWNTPIEEE